MRHSYPDEHWICQQCQVIIMTHDRFEAHRGHHNQLVIIDGGGQVAVGLTVFKSSPKLQLTDD